MKRVLNYRFLAVLALAALAALVVACASPATPALTDAPTAAPQPVAAPTTQVSPTEAPTAAPTEAPPAAPTEAPPAARSDAGMETFASTCAGCHGAEGEGARAPALIGPNAGLAKYGDAQALYDYVHTRMPARNPGSLSEQQALELVAHLLLEDNVIEPDTVLGSDSLSSISLAPAEAPAAGAEPPASDLAAAGLETFASTCAGCHGAEGEGARAPALIGPNAGLAKYGDAQALYDYVHTRMPARNPGSLSEQQALELVAHLLLEDNVIEPDTVLGSDSLSSISLP